MGWAECLIFTITHHPIPSPGPGPDHQLFGRRRVILIIDQVLCNFGVRRWIIFNQFPLYRAEIIWCWSVPVFCVLVVMTNVGAAAAARHLYSWLGPALADTDHMTRETSARDIDRDSPATFQKWFTFNFCCRRSIGFTIGFQYHGEGPYSSDDHLPPLF